MIRLVCFLGFIAAMTLGLAWLADRPGNLVLDWQGTRIETSVFLAVVLSMLTVGSALVLWSIGRNLLAGPGVIAGGLRRRRQKQGLESIASGLIAVGSGDRQLAERYTMLARRSMPNEPLTDLLRAQAAQLVGDRTTARRIYEAMLHSPETEPLGLRGLYLEAEREKEWVAARQFAERAMKLNQKLAWPAEALFELQCRQGDLAGALDTTQAARRNGHVERKVGDRRRAVLLTGLAQQLEDRDIEKAIAYALEAHELQPDFVPPAEIAGRLLASRGNLAKAATVIARTWKRNPHPELANIYAFARPGDSPRDRLKRVRELAVAAPHNRESPIAVATAAIDAHEWEEARSVLEPLAGSDLSARVCVLMARIEGGERGDTGRMREWLARAISAPRDSVWTADGDIAERWAPISPVSGRLDVYEWRVPAGSIDAIGGAQLLEQLRTLAMPRPEEEPARGVERPAPRISPRRPEVEDAEPADERDARVPPPPPIPQQVAVPADREVARAKLEAVVVRREASVSLTPRASSGQSTSDPAHGTISSAIGKPVRVTPAHAPDDPGPDFDPDSTEEANPRAANQGTAKAAS